MRLSLAQKVTLPLLSFGGQANALQYLQSLGDWAALWDLQDVSGLVALAYNNEIPVGRLLNKLTYGDYTAGAGWSNSGTEVALHTAGSVATLSQAGVLSSGKTYVLTTIITGRTAGTVTPTGGTAISASTTAQVITASGTALVYTPTTDFDGSIDLALVVLKQTGILESDKYPLPTELFTTANAASIVNEADATTGFVSVGFSATLTSDSSVFYGGLYSIKYVATAANGRLNYDLDTLLTSGQRYIISLYYRHIGSGANQTIAIGPDTSLASATSIRANIVNTEVTFARTTPYEFTHSAATKYLITSAIAGEGDGGLYVDAISITEANPFNGDNDGATVNQPLQPGIVAYDFDGTNDEVDVKSAELNSGITPLAGTMVALFKIGTAVWEDSTIRTLFRIYVDATNYITMKKGANVGEVIASYAGEGAAAVDIAHLTLSPTGTMSMIITFDIAANELKSYINGSQDGPTGAITAVMLGNVTSAVIGSTGAGEYWDGLEAHVGFMRRVMTDAERLTYTGMLNLEVGTAFDAGFDEGFI